MKNKPYLLYSLLLLCLGLGLWNFIQSREKIVYVDTAKLFQEYSETVKINKKLEEQAKQYEENIDTLMKEVQLAMSDYERKGSKLDATSRSKLEQKINEKQLDLQRYQAVIKEKLEKQRGEEFASAVNNINSFLKEYGVREGYRMILIANPAGTIAYAQDNTDITSDIIKELNQKSK
ncbi:OmpH family outer membrane protein [Sphingobacterium sp. SRCM116780]|uniref:OmpH family outer membrane protein n=1 Tax=Sphingobacterium sp. SRCM116780 TaxID=2907623 RepID=UPI001F264773|nr:OmpH family outer membrane protein [Sphingobacterium sp. SRCM116780]UIR54612.1 OmpH family outer membrane protein [Sphingobacterium sp. SRCM116780]